MVDKAKHQPFKEWHKDNLVQLLEFIDRYHSLYLTQFMNEYDEMLRGN